MQRLVMKDFPTACGRILILLKTNNIIKTVTLYRHCNFLSGLRYKHLVQSNFLLRKVTRV